MAVLYGCTTCSSTGSTSLYDSKNWSVFVSTYAAMHAIQPLEQWPWCMSMVGARFAVFVRRARVLPGPCPATRNLSFLRCSPTPSPCCFHLLFHWTGTGWCENSTRWKSCKRVRARGGGACACLAHGLQCLCDGRACCPARALQLVICRS